MVNSVDFVNRLKEVMNYHHISASVFADKISVQRSSISHILSGRNKPSLDFILKVTNTFKDVDIHWLLNGKGNFPKSEVKNETPTTTLFNQESKSKDASQAKKSIQRIVVFYTDGTFEEYKK